MRGSEQRRLLDLPGNWCWSEGVGLVGVVGELAVRGGPAGPVLPVLASDGVLGAVGGGAERLDRPLRGIGGELGPEFVPASVGRLGPVLEELQVLGVGDLAGDEVGGAVEVRGEPAVQGAGDAVVQDLRRGVRVAQPAVVGRRGGEDLVGIVSRQLRGPQESLKGGKGLVRGEAGALGIAEGAVGCEPVEGGAGAPRRGAGGDVDELIEVGHRRAGLQLGAFLLGQGGVLLLGDGEQVVQDGAWGAGLDLEGLPGLGVLGKAAGDGPGVVAVAASGHGDVGAGRIESRRSRCERCRRCGPGRRARSRHNRGRRDRRRSRPGAAASPPRSGHRRG